MSLEWLARVLLGWGAPGWVIAMACALTAHRSVRSLTGAALGPVRRMFRSIGMGGPASMLLWNIGYDPIVDAIGGPTYVDDLAALTMGPTRTLRAQFFLLAAGMFAGVCIAAHTCVFLEAAWFHPVARLILRTPAV